MTRKSSGFRTACLIVSAVVMPLFVNPLKADVLTATNLFNVPYYSTLSPNDVWSAVVSSNAHTFLVWVDSNNRPWVTQYYNGVVTTGALDAADYTAYPDGHHRFSIGIDKQGYIHVTGDMHYYPGTPANYLPARYVNQNSMYWISNQPYTVTGGFSYAGYNTSSTALPGTGFVEGRFFHDKNGELYYSTMAKAYDTGLFSQGMMALGVYKYDVNSRSWTALGGYADASEPPGTKFYKVLYWENAGYAPGGWFQNYQSTLKFDNQNRLHFATCGNVDPTSTLTTRVLYAMSPDGGTTWAKANGTIIPGLPLRGATTSPNVADIVYDNPSAGVPVYADVVADQTGAPAVYSDVWRRWNGSAWVNDLNVANIAQGTRGILGPDGKVTFLQLDTIFLRRTKSFTQNSEGFNLQAYLPTDNLHFFQCMSDIGLQQSGSIFGVGTNDTNNILYLNQLTFTSYPLPSPWADTDIGNNINLGGSADFYNNQLSQKASGQGIATNADNLNFAYQPLTGNGTIITQIPSQDSTVYAWANAGVMMRESLANNSSTVMMGVTVNSGTQMIYRNGTNSNATAINLSVTPSPQWVKLTRVGNVFTGYYSQNGSTWTQAGQITINMANTIYVGTTVWSYSIYEHFANFANIKVTQP